MQSFGKRAISTGLRSCTKNSTWSEWIFDDAPLTATDMQEFIKTAESVSLSERGYQCLRDWVAENFGHFGAIDGNVERFGEIEGDENGRSIAYIIRSKFNEVCERYKINPKALLSQLKTNELIRIRNDGKGYCIKRRMSGGIPVDCVALYLDPDEQPVEYEIDF